MALLPTGSDKILEVQAGNIHVVIKSKNPRPNVVNKAILEQTSNLKVTGLDVRSVKVFGGEQVANDDDAVGISFFQFRTTPLFFEQTDYEIVIKSTNGEAISFWHENYSVREKVSPVIDYADLLSGIINFGNQAGFSDLEVASNGKKCLVIRLEVFPSKISYKDDYREMLQDISNEVYGAVLDFMKNTYQEFSLGRTQSTVPALFFEIIKRIFDKFAQAANRIIKAPHHKLFVEHPIVPAHKARKIDHTTLRWLQKHPEQFEKTSTGYVAAKAPAIKKQITYNTTENQFTKFILQSTMKRLFAFKERYVKSTKVPEVAVLDKVDSMFSTLGKIISTSFLNDVDDYRATQSMSLVFEMAPGYRELYKYYLMLQKGLAVNGDVFRMSLKDTAQLYEYWCFIKLVSLLKKNYQLVSPDVIKVSNTGITITLVKGKKSEVKFINPRTGERIILAYNPGEQNTQTISQKPDNVLTLEKRGTEIPYKYVFDAKYRIESNPANDYYPDNKPGPKVEDINTMHRYRDSIVYENTASSRFMFEKTMFGAYVLFPYDDPEGDYKNHRFYKSIETVNIGGLPFLPGTTELVENFLAELIADSEESAFERASLPRGIEERLAKVDWSVKDVLVGTVRSDAQLQYNVAERCYYAPARFITEKDLPVRYIALYEEELTGESGIKQYGEVVTTSLRKRKDIPVFMSRDNGEELYYFFEVKEWITMEHSVAIKDTSRGKPRFTNKLLLDTCKDSYQLFSIHSDVQYRLMQELNKAFDDMTTSSCDNEAVYKINETYSVSTADGCFTIMNDRGDVLSQIPVSSFAQYPRVMFNKMMESLEDSREKP